MNICIFDTETTSTDKPFCYNVGYMIMNDEGEVLVEKEFVVEQIWHNLALFSTAYFAEKRPIYVASMRARKVTLKKFGYICQEMIRDFNRYEVACAYAYHSPFDERVFNFNCDWFKCNNPFDTIPIYDIRGNVHHYIVDYLYKDFCIKNGYLTEAGCYSSTAETVYRYLTNDTEWNEEHTALADSRIEAAILFETFYRGAEIDKSYPAMRSLGTPTPIKTLHIKTAEQTDYYFDYEKIRINKEKTEINLK